MFKIYFLLLLILNRGLIIPNKLWWSISDFILSTNRLDQIFDEYRHGTHYINIIVSKFRVVNNIDEINTILYNSPFRYRTGFLKQNYFKSFMPKNIGVIASSDDRSIITWQQMRKFNELILDTNITNSQLINHYKDKIISICNNSSIPMSREYFIDIGHQIVKLLLFGHTNVSNLIFPGSELYIFPNIIELLSKESSHAPTKNKWKKIIKNTHIEPMSMLGRIKDLDDQILEIYDQIPHWIFPIFGTITISLVRALLLDYNCSNKNNIPTRHILLETLRLYSPVTTLFRKDIETEEEILIMMQMILRDKRYFENPHSFKPERFNDKKLEFKTYCLMFSQGPQICPGKNFILFLSEILFDTIKPKFYSNIELDCDNLPDSINPFELF